MLPDQIRPASPPPARALAAALLDLLAPTTWRALHPGERGTFTETARPEPLPRLYYTANDGWKAPVLYLAATPGGSGEPVLLLHTLGLGADGFRYGASASLAEALSSAGYAVYLLHHRGDRAAIAPDEAASYCFDDIVERDLPAAIARIQEHSGFRRIHAIGHGLGGQLLYGYVARVGDHDLASIAALCAPVRFAEARSDARRWARLVQAMPSHWRLPLARAGAATAPLIDADSDLFGRNGGNAPGSRVRGVLVHALEDLSVGLLQQLERWMRADSLVDRDGAFDYVDALASARRPLLLATTAGDRVCSPSAALPAWESWGGPRELLLMPESYGHLDALLASDAPVRVFTPLIAWLEQHRRETW
jgi:predicted alpha/beta hydrolase